MKRWGVGLCCAACLALLPPAALASGSAGPGNSKVNARGAYTVGKALVFRELVCGRCATQRSDFGRDRARDLKETLLESLDAGLVDRGGDIQALCVGDAEPAGRCAARIKFVVTYLDRRYRL
ncbi:MAG: hypothetical protein OXM56_15200 [Gammaproteobacteria bacterium]|nr:hypothetical protein [Gammaproteobacteria bacterium]